VTAFPVGRDFAGSAYSDFAGTAYSDLAITNAQGTYSLLDVQPGQYKVEFSSGCGDTGNATRWYPSSVSKKDATVLYVGPGADITAIGGSVPRG
jgi:hypothetical protein